MGLRFFAIGALAAWTVATASSAVAPARPNGLHLAASSGQAHLVAVGSRSAAQRKTFRHPQVGTITLGFQGMQLEGTPGQRLGIYLADPGTPDYDAMVLLDLTAPRLAGQPARQQH